MSVKKCIGKTVNTFNRGKMKIVKCFNFVKSLSVKNKACFDIQLKSDKSFVPLWRSGFSYSKEFRVMPVIWCLVGAVAMLSAIKSAFKKK